MNYIEQERKPEVLGFGSCTLAVILHAVFFALLYFAGQLSLREDKVIIPIDLSVVMQENLDGDENEPPPIPEITPEPEPPKPPEPEPPKPEPPKPEPPKPEPPKPEPPKPDPPKPPDPPPAVEREPVKTNKVAEVKPPEKTAAELRAERIARMRASAKDIPNPPKPRATNGRTGPKTLSDAEIAKLMALGYRPGTEESIATDEITRCVSLVKMALEEKQALLRPEMGREGKVTLSIRFDRTGRVRNPALTGSSGDAKTDAAALRIVRSLDTVRGLSRSFLDEFSKSPLTIEYSMSKRR